MKLRSIKKIINEKTDNFIKKLNSFKKIKIQINDKSFHVISEPEKFWNLLMPTQWEKETFVIFDKYLDKDHSYIDIGAWIGPTVLYGCQIAKYCYAIEPDPSAFKILKKNLRLNENLVSKVNLSNIAISDSSGMIKLHASSKWGESNSSIMLKDSEVSVSVKTMTFQNFIEKFKISDCNFIKVDIEGAEFIILPTMIEYLKTNKPTLLLEFHPWLTDNPLKKLKDLQGNLEDFNFEIINDMTNGEAIHIFNERLRKTVTFLITPKLY